MLKKELCALCKFYAISPIHAGSGAATATVDLPIQRERHTHWPHIQASGVKGALRSHFRAFNQKDRDLVNLIFGSDPQDGWSDALETLPGAMSVSDAKLVAFPIRSNIAPFVWVTSPNVLDRLKRDLEYMGDSGLGEFPNVAEDSAVSLGAQALSGKVILEDAVVNITDTVDTPPLSNHFPELERLLLISDDLYAYAVSYCTEVQTHIKIDAETGTAAKGALRYEEYLPSDSLLYSIVHYAGRDASELRGGDASSDLAKKVSELKAETLKNYVEDVIKGFIQIGGDETLGKGICKLNWLKGGNQ